MTDKELERRLERALVHSAPDDLEGVLSRCGTRKGNVIPMKKNKTPAMRWLAAACLALVLVGGGAGVVYQQAYAVTSVVSLDVNPSIELSVNRNEKVLSCTPLNEDATEILSDMGGGADLKGTKLDVAVNAIVGSLVRYGYFDDISSAILISVEDKDQDRAAKLQQELTGVVDAVLQDQAANAAVLSQTLLQNAELEQLAKENNISTGKAALVNQVLTINSGLKFDELAVLSVEELKDLIETGAPGMPIGKSAALQAAEKYAGILTENSVTSKVDPELDESPAYYEVELQHPTLGKFEYKVDAYTGLVLSGQPDILKDVSGNTQITAEEAQKVALAHKSANYPALAQEDAQNISTKSEKDNGRLVYEVKFTCGGYKFEYEIDAATSAVLDWDTDYKNTVTKPETSGSTQTGTSGSTSYIGESAAKAAALAHAGVQTSAVKYCNVWMEYDDGRPEYYEVEFEANNVKYEYEIDLYNGAVLSHESENHGSSSTTTSSTTISSTTTSNQTSSSTYIGESKAKTIALADAGVQESATNYCKAWIDYENGRPDHYEVEFTVGSTQYEYEIGLSDGAILSRESETHSTSSGSSSTSSSTDIGKEKAKSVALSNAGVQESQTTKMKVELEDEDGRPVYEVEFKVGNVEYQYKIDGTNGAVLKAERDD